MEDALGASADEARSDMVVVACPGAGEEVQDEEGHPDASTVEAAASAAADEACLGVAGITSPDAGKDVGTAVGLESR